MPTMQHENDIGNAIDAAIKRGEVIEFAYVSSDGEAKARTLSPYETYKAGANHDDYVIGYDHDREGLRQFKLSSIYSEVAARPEVEFVAAP